jgi:hypothetical protein
MTKTDKIKLYMRQGHSLTSWEAIQMFRYTRLADLIHKWWKKGASFERIKHVSKDGTVYTEYRLISDSIQSNPYKSDLSKLKK